MVSVDLGEGGKSKSQFQLNYNSDGLLLTDSITWEVLHQSAHRRTSCFECHCAVWLCNACVMRVSALTTQSDVMAHYSSLSSPGM